MLTKGSHINKGDIFLLHSGFCAVMLRNYSLVNGKGLCTTVDAFQAITLNDEGEYDSTNLSEEDINPNDLYDVKGSLYD